LSPLILGWLLRDISKKASRNSNSANQNRNKNKREKSDNLGEYIDYEDIE